MIGAIFIGLIAGWLAGKLVRGHGYGIFVDILLGLVGAVIGNWILDALNVPTDGYGALGHLAMATVGAVVLVGLIHLVRSESPA
jgi:uncharacterized membrane protein YeaQ/YmgE (transglycosylase-associated protein family)